ncbi:MAG TPA: pentapeptide repeat-containing protein [Pyrinomonadaceae bacterium]|nr:pentapeptide repeat-containing protein [Pyrinomonadaceae bacterium]
MKFNCYPEDQTQYTKGDPNTKRTHFGGKATFLAAQILDSARFMGVRFNGDVDFERATIGGNALFREVEQRRSFLVAEFKKKARFLMTHIQQNAEFDGAKFWGTAIFERCRIDGNAFFRPAVCEERRRNATDGRKDSAVTCPHRPKVVHFKGQASFNGARIGGDAEFSGTYFSSRAQFAGLYIGGVAYFDASIYERIDTGPVRFKKQVTFSGADIRIRAFFTRARFMENPAPDQPVAANDPAMPVAYEAPIDFSLIKIGGSTDFKKAYFGAPTDFSLAQIGGTVSFQDTPFREQVSFRDARFGSLEFGAGKILKESWSKRLIKFAAKLLDSALRWAGLRPKTIEPPVVQVQEMRFPGGADLDGFSYSLTDPHDGKLLLDALRTSDRRQPYFFLERSLRSTGNDETADEVYLQLRNNESKRILRDTKEHFQALRLWQGFFGLLRKFLDMGWWLIANYGVRPLQLLVFSILMVVLGVLVFSRPGAVVPKEKPKEPMPDLIVSRSSTDSMVVTEVVSQPTPSPSPSSLNLTQAIGVSFGQFVPIVEIPSGNKWKPSENAIWASFPRISYAAYGTIHRLAGALLLPLGIASLTGFLHRREKPGR